MGIVLQGLLDVCCNTNIVLQAFGWKGSVSRYNFCIVTEAAGLG